MNRLAFRCVVLLVVGFLIIPIVMTVWSSVASSAVFVFPPHGFTLHWYKSISASFIDGLKMSLLVATGTTALAILTGTPAAVALARAEFPGKDLVETFCLSPLMVPTLVIGVAAFQFAVKVSDAWNVSVGGTAAGIILGQAAFTIPYVIRGVFVGHAHFDISMEEAAASLGARPLQTFWKVTLPALVPGIVSGGIFAFVMSLDDVPIALFMGGANATTLPVKIFTSIQFSLNADVMAIATILMVISLGLVLLLDYFFGLDRFFGLSSE